MFVAGWIDGFRIVRSEMITDPKPLLAAAVILVSFGFVRRLRSSK